MRVTAEVRVPSKSTATLCSIIALVLLSTASTCVIGQSPSIIDNSSGTKDLSQVPRRSGPKPAVAVYEVRSAVPEVPVGAARDMFVTALVQSGAFAVAERGRLNEGVMRERQLNQSGVSTGSVASTQIMGARYIFEVVVSEANAGAHEGGTGVNVNGLQVSRGTTSDGIGLDVRIVDAQTGVVIDAVNVVKTLESTTTNVSGVGSLLARVSSLRGRNLPVDVDAEHRDSRKEGVDRALRACIQTSVAALARRLAEE